MRERASPTNCETCCSNDGNVVMSPELKDKGSVEERKSNQGQVMHKIQHGQVMCKSQHCEARWKVNRVRRCNNWSDEALHKAMDAVIDEGIKLRTTS